MQASDTQSLVIHQVAHGQGMAWLSYGWSMFRRQWQTLAVLSAGMLILLWLLGARTGGVLVPVLTTIYLGIVAAYCRMDREGEVFLARSGAWRNPALWALAIVVGIASLAQVAIVGAIAAGAVMQGMYTAAHIGKGLFYAFAAAQLLVILAFSTLWLAPALVVEHKVGVLRALGLSVAASLRNPLPFLTVVVLGGIMMLLSMLLLGLGMIVTMPILACAAAKAADELLA